MARGPWADEADLIVVGASTAGLLAAVTAADRGCRTIVLERTKELGGAAAADAELVAAAGTRFQEAAGVADTPAALADDIVAATRHRVDADLAAALAGQSAALVAWLADRCGNGVELLATHCAAGHSVPRLHCPGERGGATLAADLARAASRHSHVVVRTGAAADRLVRDDGGAVRGVAIRGDRRSGPQSLGGAVLLACGGFAADDALVSEHCPEAAALPWCGPARAAGDALRLTGDTGAQRTHMTGCLVTPFLAMPSQLVIGTPLVGLGAILVNQAGRRFADETSAPLALATTVRAQPGRVAYLLFDDRIAAAARALDPFFARVLLPRTGRRGTTLEDLARQFELDLAGLRLTIETFNGNLELGGDPFGRQSFDGPLEAPFHAIRVTGARTRTLGGLAVDRAGRVLGTAGTPIPGLYAAGGAAAALGGEGTDGPLAGTDALAALGLARLAALDVIAAGQAARDADGG
jgi:fumarate reductase flavoprotein subunit